MTVFIHSADMLLYKPHVESHKEISIILYMYMSVDHLSPSVVFDVVKLSLNSVILMHLDDSVLPGYRELPSSFSVSLLTL